MTTEALRPRLANPAWRQARIPTLFVAAILIGAGLFTMVELPATEPVEAAMAAGVGLVSIWMFASVRYELTLAVVMLYMGLADGYLKLKTGSDVATLGRDVLLYAVVAGILVRAAIRGERLKRPPLTGWVIAWAVVVLVQLANPNNGELTHSISAVRQHLEFIPLFFLGYLLLQSKTRIQGFLLLMVLIATLNGIVGLIQFNMTPEQLSAWGPGYESKISGDGDVSGRGFVTDSGELRTRPFALGSDMGFGGIVGLMAVPAALALVAVGSGRARVLAILLSGGVVLAVVTSQARVAVIGAVVAALAYLALSVTSRGAFRAVMALSLAVLVTYGSVSILTSNSDSGAFDRYSDIAPNEALATAYDYRRDTLVLIPEYIREIPLGAGIGSKGPAASRDGGPRSSMNLNAESQFTFLIIEVGLPGLLVMLAFQLKLVGLSMRRVRRLADPKERLLVAAIAAPLVALLATWIVGVSTATTPSAPYLFFAAGVLAYWLITKREEDEAAAALAFLPPEPPTAAEPVMPSPVSDPPRPAAPPAPEPAAAPETPVPARHAKVSNLLKRAKSLRKTMRRKLGARLG